MSAAVEHKDLLRQYLRRRLRKLQDLDDLAQEVYLRLLRMRDDDQVMRIDKPIAYVTVVAARVLADWHERRGAWAENTVSLDTGNPEHLEEAAEAIEEAAEEALPDHDPGERLARQQHLETVFAQLPPIQVAALLLHCRDGLSYKEIAARLNLSVKMVQYHLWRARARIRLTPWLDNRDSRP